MELLAGDDPHGNALLLHHRKQGFVFCGQPVQPQLELLSDARELGERRYDSAVEQLDGAVCPVRDRGLLALGPRAAECEERQE